METETLSLHINIWKQESISVGCVPAACANLIIICAGFSAKYGKYSFCNWEIADEQANMYK